jgi:hypothetical protein
VGRPLASASAAPSPPRNSPTSRPSRRRRAASPSTATRSPPAAGPSARSTTDRMIARPSRIVRRGPRPAPNPNMPVAQSTRSIVVDCAIGLLAGRREPWRGTLRHTGHSGGPRPGGPGLAVYSGADIAPEYTAKGRAAGMACGGRGRPPPHPGRSQLIGCFDPQPERQDPGISRWAIDTTRSTVVDCATGAAAPDGPASLAAGVDWFSRRTLCDHFVVRNAGYVYAESVRREIESIPEARGVRPAMTGGRRSGLRRPAQPAVVTLPRWIP